MAPIDLSYLVINPRERIFGEVRGPTPREEAVLKAQLPWTDWNKEGAERIKSATPGELCRIVARSLEQAAESPDYVVTAHAWHEPDGQRNRVCASGATIAFALGAPKGTNVDPNNFGSDRELYQVITALDTLRGTPASFIQQRYFDQDELPRYSELDSTEAWYYENAPLLSEEPYSFISFIMNLRSWGEKFDQADAELADIEAKKAAEAKPEGD